MKVLMCSHPVAVRCVDYVHLFDKNDVAFVETMQEDEDVILELSQDADVIMTVVKPFNAALIERLPSSVKCIVRVAIGYDTIDVKAASQKGILVCNVPDYGLQEVAVHAMALTLSVIRKVCIYNDMARQGKWTHQGMTAGYPTHRLSTLTLGLMGFGGIAKMVGKYAAGFDMKVIACDPFVPDEIFAQQNVEKVNQKELFARSDVLSLHVPLFPDTTGMINRENIQKMKDGVIIINTARGGLVNEAELIEGLQSGKVRAAGLDVFENEPNPDADYALYQMENVVTTPHIAYYSEESYQDLQRKAVEIAIDAAKGGIPYSAVNKKALGL